MDFLIKCRGLLRGKDIINIKKAMEEKRFFPRVRCAIDVKCIRDNGQGLMAIVNEISLQGIRMISAERVKRGELLRIEPIVGLGLLRDDDYDVRSVTMRVIWMRKRKSIGDYTWGLEYADEKVRLEASWVALVLKRFGVSVGTTRQKRKGIRIPAEMPIKVILTQLHIPGTVRDIGVGGMLFETGTRLNNTEILGYRIGPYRNLNTLFCDGRIAHHRHLASSKTWIYGIIFERMTDKRLDLLNSYLAVLMLDAGC